MTQHHDHDLFKFGSLMILVPFVQCLCFALWTVTYGIGRERERERFSAYPHYDNTHRALNQGVIVLDHHASAQEALATFPEENKAKWGGAWGRK